MLFAAGEEGRVAVSNASGGYRARYAGGELSVEGLEGLRLDGARASKLMNASLTAQAAVEGGGERLADFGLSDPAARIELSGADGGKTVLAVGDRTPGEASRYVLSGGEVYTVRETSLEPFFFRSEDFLSRQITPSEGEVERAAVSGRGREEPLELALAEQQELADYGVRTYVLRAPLEYPADPARAEELFASVTGLTAEAVEAVRPGEGELEALGLADPWLVLELAVREDGALQTLTIALSEPDGSGMAYALAEDVAYRLQTGELSWLQAGPEELASREVLVLPVQRLRELAVERPEGALVFSLDWEDGACRVTLGDQELDWDSFRNFYYTLVSLSADEVLFSGLPDTEGLPLLAKVTFTMEDGEEASAAYYQESDRRVCVQTGDRGCRLAYTQLRQMLDRLDRLAAGEKVEARY